MLQWLLQLKSVCHLSMKKYDEIKTERDGHKPKVKNLDKNVSHFKSENVELKNLLSEVQKFNFELKKEVLDIQYSLRDKLRFTNIPELLRTWIQVEQHAKRK